MENEEKAKACLAWLNKNYILSSLSIADILSRCLKKKVTVNGSGLDGNDLTAKNDLMI